MVLLPVNTIIPFSNVDGPGNRLTLFVQGCNLKCGYCHNRETLRLCCHCGICIMHCKSSALEYEEGRVVWDKTKCIGCDTCVKICPHEASPKVRWMTQDQIMAEIHKARPFIRGVTFSGGEPSLYSGFLLDLIPKVKALGLTVLMDTNGEFDLEEIMEVIQALDGVMIDIKTTENHTDFFGKAGLSGYDNLKKLLVLDRVAEVRTVIVDGISAEETVKKVAACLREYKNVPYRLLRGHTQGLYGRYFEAIEEMVPSPEKMQNFGHIAFEHGAQNVILTI